jgi:hypothetical protein
MRFRPWSLDEKSHLIDYDVTYPQTPTSVGLRLCHESLCQALQIFPLPDWRAVIQREEYLYRIVHATERALHMELSWEACIIDVVLDVR